MPSTGLPSLGFWGGRAGFSAFLSLDTRVWGKGDADPDVASCTCGSRVILRRLLITLVKALQKLLG